jgi:ribosomal protein S18 acetylase RimI-like enzyme
VTRDIIPLERERWAGYRLEFRYVSRDYYDLELVSSVDGFRAVFTKKPLVQPFEKTPDDTDKLFQPWWDDIEAWGVVDNGRLAAAIETASEDWSNRLRVTELWIDGGYRRQGLGTALMDIAVKRAKDEKRRAVILETQSCNAGAVAFYLNYGFSLIGFDACAYTNNDVRCGEVRMEMGFLI